MSSRRTTRKYKNHVALLVIFNLGLVLLHVYSFNHYQLYNDIATASREARIIAEDMFEKYSSGVDANNVLQYLQQQIQQQQGDERASGGNDDLAETQQEQQNYTGMHT